MPNFTKALNLEKPLRGEFYEIDKHNENSDKIDFAIEKITVPTIEHLKNMIELKVGDMVNLQGYYTAGDGAHHKRKIESADDGSGVQLANGLWANIVHNDEVNVSWFGAVENTDCFEVFKKAIEYARSVLFDSGKTYICNGRIDLNNKKIKLGTKTTLIKNDGVDEPMIWCNGNNFIIEGEGLGSLIKSTFSLSLGVICIGNLGLDGVGRNVLYGNIRHLEVATPGQVNAANGSCTLAFVSPQYNSLANYFHHVDDVRVTGGDAGILLWGWANGNNFSNLHLYDNKTKGIYFKAMETKHPLDNNISNIFHHNSLNATTVYMEAGATNIITGLNCEQGGPGAMSVFATDEMCMTNTFIISSNVSFSKKINEHNNVIDTFGHSSFINLDLKSMYSKTLNTRGFGVVREYNFEAVNLEENKAYKLVKISGDNLLRGEQLLLEVKIAGRSPAGIMLNSNCSTLYSISKEYPAIVERSTANSYDLIKENNDFYIVTKINQNGTGTKDVILSINVTVNRVTTEEVVTQHVEEYAGEVTKPVNELLLNTPYYATKMQQEGVYEDFIEYMDERHEYEQSQRNATEGVSTLNVLVEPKPSQALLDFKKKYLG